MSAKQIEELAVRYMSTKPGVSYKDGKLYLTNVADQAVISFDGDDIVVDYTESHPKKSHGQMVIKADNYDEVMNQLNGLYTEVFPLEY